jgi:hypothetical protein
VKTGDEKTGDDLNRVATALFGRVETRVTTEKQSYVLSSDGTVLCRGVLNGEGWARKVRAMSSRAKEA